MMTTRILAVPVLLAVLGCASAGTTRRAGIPHPPEQEIVRLQEAWVQAALDADEGAFAQFMDDDFKVVSEGRVRDKDTWVGSIRSGQARYSQVQYRNADVNLYGDTIAVISGEYPQVAARGAQDNSGNGVFVETWAKRDGQWRIIGSIHP